MVRLERVRFPAAVVMLGVGCWVLGIGGRVAGRHGTAVAGRRGQSHKPQPSRVAGSKVEGAWRRSSSPSPQPACSRRNVLLPLMFL